MTITKAQQEAAQREARAKAASDGSQAEQAGEPEPLWRPEELSDIVTIDASARASELRVDECTASTAQGESHVRRVGLPPTGAEPGVTYRNVQVSLEIKGGPPRGTRSG